MTKDRLEQLDSLLEDEGEPFYERAVFCKTEFARRRAIFEQAVKSCRWHDFSVRGRNGGAI